MNNRFNIGSALSYGWNQFKLRPGFFIIICVISGVLYLIPELIGQFTAEDYFGISMIFTVIAAVISMWMTLGETYLGLQIYAGKEVQVSGLFSQYKLILKYFLASLLYGIAALIGFILLIIPGIIVVLMFELFSYFMVDQQLGAVASLKASMQATKGNRLNLFLLGIVLMLINMAGALALGVGLFITIPVSWMAMIYVYKQLSAPIATNPAQAA